MKRRLVTVAVGVTIAALTLTGCTEIRSIGEKAGIDLALQSLAATLDESYGITAVTAAELDQNYHYSVNVSLDADGVTTQNRVGLITAVDETLGGSAFGSADVRFAIGDYENDYYSQGVFGLDTLPGDLRYWEAVEAAVGEVSFGISSDPDGDGPQTRARNIHRPSAVDYAALQQIELDATALDTWSSAGITAYASLPSAAAAEVLIGFPALDYTVVDQPLGLGLDWSSQPTWTLLSASLPDEATDPAASADWPVAVDAVSQIVASGIRGSQFTYMSPFGAGGIVYLGECAGEQSVGPGDEALLAGLVAAGVELPEGTAPGWCAVI